MKWTSWVALAALLGVGGFVVYASFHAGAVRCEVCMDFAGRTACRTVEGATKQEARAAARTNACAMLTSGVTNMMACERGAPVSENCRRGSATAAEEPQDRGCAEWAPSTPAS